MDAPRPRVLIIPGLDGDTGLWRSVAAQALPGMRPLWFDHSTDRAEGDLQGLAQRALRVLNTDIASEAPAYMCGESFGGPVALTLARHHPNRVRGLLLFATFGRFPSRPNLRFALHASRLAGDRLTHELMRWLHPLTANRMLGRDAPQHIARAYLTRRLTDVRAYRAKCALSLQFNAESWLHEIRAPALVIAGSDDEVVPTSATHGLARGLPHRSARFQAVTLPGAFARNRWACS